MVEDKFPKIYWSNGFLINGQIVTASELCKNALTREDILKFHDLAKKWKEETFIISSINVIESNPSYLEIIDMGEKVLPLIFQDLKTECGFWFSALEEMTGCNPIEESHRGFIKLMKEDWLKWGKEHRYV